MTESCVFDTISTPTTLHHPHPLPPVPAVSKGSPKARPGNPCQALSRQRRASVPEGCLCGTEFVAFHRSIRL